MTPFLAVFIVVFLVLVVIAKIQDPGADFFDIALGIVWAPLAVAMSLITLAFSSDVPARKAAVGALEEVALPMAAWTVWLLYAVA